MRTISAAVPGGALEGLGARWGAPRAAAWGRAASSLRAGCSTPGPTASTCRAWPACGAPAPPARPAPRPPAPAPAARRPRLWARWTRRGPRWPRPPGAASSCGPPSRPCSGTRSPCGPRSAARTARRAGTGPCCCLHRRHSTGPSASTRCRRSRRRTDTCETDGGQCQAGEWWQVREWWQARAAVLTCRSRWGWDIPRARSWRGRRRTRPRPPRSARRSNLPRHNATD